MIIFALGIIIGILIRDIKFGSIKVSGKIKQVLKPPEKVKFIEPMSDKEKFDNAETPNDLINE